MLIANNVVLYQMEREFQIGPQKSTKRISHKKAHKAQMNFSDLCAFLWLIILWLRRGRVGRRRLERRRGRVLRQRFLLLQNMAEMLCVLLPE